MRGAVNWLVACRLHDHRIKLSSSREKEACLSPPLRPFPREKSQLTENWKRLSGGGDKHKKDSPIIASFFLARHFKILTSFSSGLGIGCASFGHSCYGGHGKRSDPAIQGQENDAASAEPLTMIRVLQRRFQPEAVAMTNEIQEREREIKLMVLNVLSEVINDVLKKSTQPEDSLA